MAGHAEINEFFEFVLPGTGENASVSSKGSDAADVTLQDVAMALLEPSRMRCLHMFGWSDVEIAVCRIDSGKCERLQGLCPGSRDMAAAIGQQPRPRMTG